MGATMSGTSGYSFTYVAQLPTAPVCMAARPVLKRLALPKSCAARGVASPAG